MTKPGAKRKFKKVLKSAPQKQKFEDQVFDSKFWVKKLKGVKDQVSKVIKKSPDT